MLKVASILTRIGIGLALLALSVGIVVVLFISKPKIERKAATESVRQVRIVEATSLPVRRVWTGYGAAQPLTESTLSAQLTARVVERPEHIRAGARVRKGELIVALDAADFQDRLEAGSALLLRLESQLDAWQVDNDGLANQVQQADQELRLAQAELDRLQDALQRNASNAIEIERAESAVARLSRQRAALVQAAGTMPSKRAQLQSEMANQRAQVALLERDASRARIVSPFDGFIESIEVQPGELVTQGMQVARVLDLSRIEIPLRIPASAIGRIAIGDAVQIRTEPPTEHQWTGRIARLAPQADLETRSAVIYAEVEQQSDADAAGDPGTLLPGRFVMATIPDRVSQMRFVVPRHAILDASVLVAAENGVAGEFRAVRAAVTVEFYIDALYPMIDQNETQWAVVSDGLREGDRIIVTNLDEIAPDSLVEIGRIGGSRADAAGEERTP